MPRILVVPGALLPAPIALDVLRATDAPVLTSRLVRATPGPLVEAAPALAGAAHLDWLARAFGLPAQPPATAPYAWAALAATAGSGSPAADAPPAGTLWFADPVHLAFARDHLLVTPLDEPALQDPAAPLTAALLAAANDAGADFGATFALRGGRWFVRLAAPWQLQVPPLEAAVHLPVQQVWPDGPDGAPWRRLANAVQMAWHALPANEARADAGLPAVNGLWIHGGGDPVALRPPHPIRYVGTDAVLRGWQGAAVPASAAGPADTLTTWPALFDAARREDWASWIEAWQVLAAQVASLQLANVRRGGTVRLVLGGLRAWRTVELRTLDRFRIWRPARLRTLAALLGEPPSAEPAARAVPVAVVPSGGIAGRPGATGAVPPSVP